MIFFNLVIILTTITSIRANTYSYENYGNFGASNANVKTNECKFNRYDSVLTTLSCLNSDGSFWESSLNIDEPSFTFKATDAEGKTTTCSLYNNTDTKSFK